MKVLGGVVQPDSGRVRLHGREHAYLTVAEAGAQGIAFVHQELSVFDNLDVAANVLIGREPVWGGPLRLVDRGQMARLSARVIPRSGSCRIGVRPAGFIAKNSSRPSHGFSRNSS